MKKKIRRGVMYVFLITVGIVLIYPLVWMFFATLKRTLKSLALPPFCLPI